MAMTYGVKIDAGGFGDPAVTADALHEAFFTAFGTLISSQYTLFQTEIRWRDTAVADLSVVLHVEPKVCTGTSAPLPQNCAGLVHKRSLNAGRRHRGRMFYPGLSETDVDAAGVVGIGTLNAVNAKLTAWLTSIKTTIGAIDEMVILHGTGISGAPTPTVVTSMLMDGRLATQRRRLRR